MQILFLADAVFEDLSGGSRVVARELARGLVARGHQVTFLVARQTADAPADVSADGVRIVRYPGAGNPLAFVREGRRACRRLCAERPFDVVHTHFAYAALGPLRAVPPAVPHVRSFYGPWHMEGWVEDQTRLKQIGSPKSPRALAKTALYRLKYALRSQVERANLRRSRAAIVLSEHSRGEVLALGYPPDKITLIPGGTDIARFQPADKQATRASLGLPQDRRLLLSIRRLAPRMGLDNLLRALPAVTARHPDLLLLIGGKGPEHGRLQQLITDLRLTDHARLVGFIPDAQLAAYYQSADLFVLPTLALEGFGLVTTEALACGVPVVGTPIGATPEILNRLDPRLVASSADPDALAQAILGGLDGGWAAALTPDRLHRFVRDHYTWDRHVAAVEAIYASLIHNPRLGTMD